jgi:hypothetical protein
MNTGFLSPHTFRHLLIFLLVPLLVCCSAQPTQAPPVTNPPPNSPPPNSPPPTGSPPTAPAPGPVKAASLLLAQQNNAQQTSPFALASSATKNAVNSSTLYHGLTVYLYMNGYSMSNKLMGEDTFSADSFKYGPKGSSSASEGLSLLDGLNKDIYLWVSGNVPGALYDDVVWAQVTNNFRALAQAASALNKQGDYHFKGIFFDDESSKVNGFFPFDCAVYGSYEAGDTCEQRQLKMRERGKQIMAAMLSVWPEVTWVQLHTPAVSVPGYDDTPLRSNPSVTVGGLFDFDYDDYELAGPFFAGLVEAVQETKTGIVVSGGNIYKLRNKDDFQDHETYVAALGNLATSGSNNVAWLPESLKGDVWTTTVDVGFGVYNKDFPPLPSFPYTDLAVPTEKLTNARCIADKLVFLYIEPDEGSGSENWYTNLPEKWQGVLQNSAVCN